MGAAIFTGAMAELAQQWLTGSLGDDLDVVVDHALALVRRRPSAGQGEVLGERLDDGAPHRLGQVVAHAVDDDELRAGMARARLRPLRGRTIGSSVPWMTTVGAAMRRV